MCQWSELQAAAGFPILVPGPTEPWAVQRAQVDQTGTLIFRLADDQGQVRVMVFQEAAGCRWPGWRSSFDDQGRTRLDLAGATVWSRIDFEDIEGARPITNVAMTRNGVELVGTGYEAPEVIALVLARLSPLAT